MHIIIYIVSRPDHEFNYGTLWMGCWHAVELQEGVRKLLTLDSAESFQKLGFVKTRPISDHSSVGNFREETNEVRGGTKEDFSEPSGRSVSSGINIY